MRKLGAFILSFAVIYGITLIPSTDSGRSNKKTLTYTGINNEAVRALHQEIANAQSNSSASMAGTKNVEVVNSQVAGKEKFVNTINTTVSWMKENQILYRHQFNRSFESMIKKLDSIQASEVEIFNDQVNSIINSHIGYSKALKFSPKIVADFQDRLSTFLNPLKVTTTVSTVQTTVPVTTQTKIDFSSITKKIENLKQNKTIIYETHAHENAPQTVAMVLLYLAGLLVGVVGFASFHKNATAEVSDKSDMDALSGTMKRVLKDLNYPVVVCDSQFKVSWDNTEAQKLELNADILQSLLSDSAERENYKAGSKSYSVRVEELKYKSGKISYVLQMIPHAISPELLSNVIDNTAIEKVLERSFEGSKDLRNLNELVAENTMKMNYLFKSSAKFIDVDLDETLSECFIESDRLNDAVREFMMGNYHLIKDDAQISGMYLRTSEKGQRFNLNCFIPSINKEAFATGEASRVFVQSLAGLETKFNLYYPRVSFRWISEGETKGVDICLSLENKSELESILRESNA